jgi:glutaredoxin
MSGDMPHDGGLSRMPARTGWTPGQFRVALVVVLCAVFAALQIAGTLAPPPAEPPAWQQDGRLHVFFHPDCPHCHKAIAFLNTQPSIAVVLHDVSKPAAEARVGAVAQQHGIADADLGVPLFVRGARYLIGFDSAETTGQALLALAGEAGAPAQPGAAPTRIALPLFGEIDPTHYSLLALTALMGLSDGFNPCAMWVLVYLISLIAGIQEQRKIWWLVGTFVLTSGILYFLFMTAWLNTFLIIGYVRPLTQIVALAAIGFGLDHFYQLALTRGVIVCEVGNVPQRQRTMRWIRDIVAAPVGLASLVLVIGLAFTVNAIEFICSAALPAIYTHMLALTELSTGQYYGYIALYVTFFMLDDLVIFGLAAIAAQKIVDTRYAVLSRAAGGALLIGLGAWMLLR